MTDKQALRYLSPVKTLMKRLDFDKHYIEALETAMQALKDRSERPQGKWIKDEEHSITIEMFKCTNCGYWNGADHFNFCPSCGAQMVGDPK